MLDLIKENNVIIGSIIGIITLLIAMRQIRISNQKHRMDKEDFISKKPNLSLYLENCYRLSYNSSKSINVLFCIMIINKSSNRNTVIPKLEMDYLENGITRTIKLSHDKKLFHKKYHSQIDKFDNSIQLEPKDMKYGWIIFQMPEILKHKRIEKYRIIIQDGEKNTSKAECLLIKEIHYDD
ncbi:hypothetical protein PN604_18350 [Parabacteroides merdae]|uniref:hypothetical protein n=1 Tax=Parabacteroides merdae TaxID=46503 RepID=UPI001898A60A|nr:hypothetical protein [Parabacteroides merdae]MDB8922930.1 hypothetical protein [Parabacteroides merdae]